MRADEIRGNFELELLFQERCGENWGDNKNKGDVFVSGYGMRLNVPGSEWSKLEFRFGEIAGELVPRGP